MWGVGTADGMTHILQLRDVRRIVCRDPLLSYKVNKGNVQKVQIILSLIQMSLNV